MVVLIGCLVGSFFWGRSYERRQIAETARADTTVVRDTIRITAKTKAGKATATMAAFDTTLADSIFEAGLRDGIDSVRSLYLRAMAPKHFSTDIDSVGHIDVTYVPVADSFFVAVEPLPRIERTRIVTITKFIRESDERWRTVGLISIAAVVIETVAVILRH